MEDIDLNTTLNEITKAAINDFLFPKCKLDFEYDNSRDRVDGLDYGYYFIDEAIGLSELNVILAFMKVH
jgi:hypothetical protein